MSTGASPVARRVTAARRGFEATVEYRPRGVRQLAGITAYYDARAWYCPRFTADALERRCCGWRAATGVR